MSESLDSALRELPHGASFRFVETLVSLDPGRSGVGNYRIRGDEGFLEGHFPGHPIMPGVILIEAIAQLGGIVAQTDPGVPKMADLRLAAVRAAKILGAAVPGQTLMIHAQLEGRLENLVQIGGEIRLDGQLLASAKVTLSGAPVPR